MKNIKKIGIASGAFLMPMFAFAQNTTQLFNLLSALKRVINVLIPIALALIFLGIIWNAYKLVTADGEEKAEYRGELIKMVVIFFVVMSIYGIVYFLGRTLGIGQGGSAAIPCVTGTYQPSTGECN